MKKNIAFYITSLRIGGREKRLSYILKALCESNNYNIYLLINEKIIDYDVDYTKVNVIIIPKYKFYSLIFKCLENKIELIHTWGFIETFQALPLKLFGIKIINSAITGNSKSFNYNKFENLFWSFVLSMTDLTLSNSNYNLNSFIIKNKFDIINNFIEEHPSSPYPFSIKKKYNLPLGKSFITMVANFTTKKNYKLFFEVAHEISHLNSDLIFIAIGDGDTYNYFNNYKLKNNIQNIILLGKLSNSEVQEVISVTDIGILLSYYEGVSNSVCEFMIQGKPLIVVEQGGMNEVLVNNYNSKYFSNINLSELVCVIFELADKENYVAKYIGENAKKSAIEKFNLQNNMKMYINYYEIYLN